jgi:hypothetical protein
MGSFGYNYLLKITDGLGVVVGMYLYYIYLYIGITYGHDETELVFRIVFKMSQKRFKFIGQWSKSRVDKLYFTTC